MKLQVGTEFNVRDENRDWYRKVVYEHGFYRAVDEEGLTVTSRCTLEELNDYYKKFKVELISKSVNAKLDEISSDEIGRAIAYALMKKGKVVGIETLEIIEDAVFDLLVEKDIIKEA